MKWLKFAHFEHPNRILGRVGMIYLKGILAYITNMQFDYFRKMQANWVKKSKI